MLCFDPLSVLCSYMDHLLFFLVLQFQSYIFPLTSSRLHLKHHMSWCYIWSTTLSLVPRLWYRFRRLLEVLEQAALWLLWRLEYLASPASNNINVNFYIIKTGLQEHKLICQIFVVKQQFTTLRLNNCMPESSSERFSVPNSTYDFIIYIKLLSQFSSVHIVIKLK